MAKYNQDQCIFQHTNKIYMVCLSHKHSVVAENLKIEKIEFHHLQNKDHTKLVSGKKKRGGLKVSQKTQLCTIHTEGGLKFHIRAGVSGTLMEINDQVFADFSLINREPESKGFLFLINPNNNTQEISQLGNMIPEEDYA